MAGAAGLGDGGEVAGLSWKIAALLGSVWGSRARKDAVRQPTTTESKLGWMRG